MSLLRVYISGPITKGDRVHNFAQAATAQVRLITAGFAPLNPMLTMQHPEAWNIPFEDWIEIDLAWVGVADAVLRLPGESKGAAIECRRAAERRIPVFTSIEQLIEWRANKCIAV